MENNQNNTSSKIFSTDEKSVFVIQLLDYLFKHWESELISYDYSSEEEKKLYCNQPPKSTFEKIASFSFLGTLPLAQTQKNFKTLIMDACSDLFAQTYKDVKHPKDGIRCELITTQFLEALDPTIHNLRNRKFNKDIVSSYFDYPFSMVAQLLFLIRRTWSTPIPSNNQKNIDTETSISLYDATLLSYKRALQKRDFLDLYTKIKKGKNSTTTNNKDPQRVTVFSDTACNLENMKTELYKLHQELCASDEYVLNLNINALKEAFQQINCRYVVMHYLHYILNEEYVLSMLLGDIQKFNDKKYDYILQMELLLIALTEYEALSQYSRTSIDSINKRIPLKSKSGDFEFKTSDFDGATPLYHIFLTTTRHVNISYYNKFLIFFEEPLALSKIKEYGDIVNTQCRNCKYINQVSDSRMLCTLGGCDETCKVHLQLLEKTKETFQIFFEKKFGKTD